jgi:2-dehydro-3-deoxyphosphogluconate aldolase/(4S)-4-hydroxy-2-oxoglutarate aldolase
MPDKLFSNQSIIISLDADAFLFDKLKQISQAGLSVVEINSCNKELLNKALQNFPELRIGSGNIINTQQLEDCYQVGTHFVSSPGFLPSIAQTATIYSVNYLPGIATPSEAMQVMALGYHQARPFPASLDFCSLLNKALPTLRLFPAEIELEKIEEYLRLPAVAGVTIYNPTQAQLQALSSGVFA